MVDKETLQRATEQALHDRGVDLAQLASVLHDIQHPYLPTLSVDDCLMHIHMVLRKREVQHAVLTGIAIDVLCEEKKLPSPIQEVIATDEGLYGIDEILALSITNIYGSIGLTNFGFLDKTKPGIIGVFDNKSNPGKVHTFLDDILCAIIAAAASRLAHSHQ